MNSRLTALIISSAIHGADAEWYVWGENGRRCRVDESAGGWERVVW